MANEIWRNSSYGTLDNGGKERAIDYSGGGTYFAPVRAAILMDENENLLGASGSPMYITGNVTDEWEILTLSDITHQDNDKSFTVPSGYEYQFLSATVMLATDATVADRQMQVDFRDENDVILSQYRAGAVQAASTTGYYVFAPSIADLDSFRDTEYLSTPVAPTTFMLAGEDVRFFENNNAGSTDIMSVQVRVARRGV